MAFERSALKKNIGILLSGDVLLQSYCLGGIHYRVVTPGDDVPVEGFPEHVNPTVVWDLQAGVDDNAAGDRVLTGMVLTAKVIAEQDPSSDEFANITSALDRLATLLDNLRDVQDGVRIRLVSSGTIDIPEPISGGRFLDHVGRRYQVILSTN